MNPISINPVAIIGAGAICISIGFAAGWKTNGWRLEASIQNEKATRGDAVIGAIGLRVKENESDESKFKSVNEKIEGKKSEEIDPIVKRVNDAPRLRVGVAICPAVANPGKSKSDDAASSDSGNPPSRLVREDVDRDIKALIIAVEKDLATGRACQAFGKENGFIP